MVLWLVCILDLIESIGNITLQANAPPKPPARYVPKKFNSFFVVIRLLSLLLLILSILSLLFFEHNKEWLESNNKYLLTS